MPKETITQTRITLKKVQHSASLSEETLAFTADVYFDGKRIGSAKNDGQGGCTFIRPYEGTGPKLAEAEAFAKTMPHVGQFGGKHYDFGMHSLDSVVDDLLVDYLARRDLKRALSKKTIGVVGGKVLEMRWAYCPESEKAFLEQHPTAVILNALPFDKALELYENPGA